MKLITVFRKEWKYFEIAFEKYEGQWQVGITYTHHAHNTDISSHRHLILDFGFYYLELTFGNSHEGEKKYD